MPTDKEPRKAAETWTTPRQFRLTDEDLAILDAIAAELDRTQGAGHSRADAIRWAARGWANQLGLKWTTKSLVPQKGKKKGGRSAE